MIGAETAAAFNEAIRLHEQGRRSQSEALCAQVVQAEPWHFAAWHLKGVLALERGAADEAMELIGRSLSISGDQPDAHSNLGNALLARRRPREALQCFDAALRLRPDFVNAIFNRGLALRGLGRWQEALQCFDRVRALRPRDVRARCNHAATLCDLGRPQEALAALDALLKQQPALIEAQLGRAAALLALGLSAEALASYEQAARLAPADPDAHYGRGNALFRLGFTAGAVAAYDCALELSHDFPEALNNRSTALRVLRKAAEALASSERALQLRPDFAEAHFSRGNALQDLERYREALTSYDRALELRPGYVDAITNSGVALAELDEHERALASFDRALALRSDHVAALTNRAYTLGRLHRHAQAAETLARLLEITPGNDAVVGLLVSARLHCSDWRDFARHAARITDRVRAAKDASRPLDFLAVSDEAAAQLQCARLAAAERVPASLPPFWKGERYGHERIRVAYVSGDFGEHPVTYLLAGVLERHDPERFEVIGISLRDDPSPPAQRIRRACTSFIDVSAKDDRAVALLLRELEVDIAVDLHGFTHRARKGLFASRPAPVQVNYLGYPGTMGGESWDYVIADEFVIPPSLEGAYAEKVVRLPECFQPNDTWPGALAQHPAPARAAAGLPESGLVLCCFNSSYKLNPRFFDIWMRLLERAPQSVLWLQGGEAVVRENLLREAAARGIGAERLVFAPRSSYAEHLARLSLADLFLDTLPFNAGATASDALRAGVPLLTCAGEAFAARMAGSLLRAVGLPELICSSVQEYEQRALNLLCEPQRLAELRARLAANLPSAPLFDSERYCRSLEAAYLEMAGRVARGEPATALRVAAPR